MTEQVYKVLGKDGSPCHGGTGRWSLPAHGQPSEWMPAIEGDLVPCVNGYHLCRLSDLSAWLGPTIWVAEHDGESIELEDKLIVRRARLLRQVERWNALTARLFAADCAEHVLSVYEARYPGDSRPRDAIEVARRYARGDASDNELADAYAATSAAAMAASADAWADAVSAYAWAAWAATEAARAARAAIAAIATAGAAAAADAAIAATAAEGTKSAWVAEREWQTRRLAQYLGIEVTR